MKSCDKLKAEINEIKIKTFDYIWTSRDMNPKTMGYSSLEEMALAQIKRAGIQIENKMLAWERANPE